jgi:hypothetical protein
MTAKKRIKVVRKIKPVKARGEGTWSLWTLALSPLAWLLFAIMLNVFGEQGTGMMALGIFWSATVGIFIPCVLIYFSWNKHYKSTQAAIFLLLLNIGIAWFELQVCIGAAI